MSRIEELEKSIEKKQAELDSFELDYDPNYFYHEIKHAPSFKTAAKAIEWCKTVWEAL